MPSGLEGIEEGGGEKTKETNTEVIAGMQMFSFRRMGRGEIAGLSARDSFSLICELAIEDRNEDDLRV